MIYVQKYQISNWYGIGLDSLAKLEENCGPYFLGTRVSKIVGSLRKRVENILITIFKCLLPFILVKYLQKRAA